MNTAFTRLFNFFGLYTSEQVDTAFVAGRKDSNATHAMTIGNMRQIHRKREQELIDELRSRDSELAKKETELRELSEHAAELQNLISQLTSEKAGHQGELDTIREEAADAVHNEQKALAELEITRDSEQRLRREIDNIRRRNARMARQSENQSSVIADYEKTVKSLKSEKTILEAMVSDCEAEIRRLSGDIQ